MRLSIAPFQLPLNRFHLQETNLKALVDTLVKNIISKNKNTALRVQLCCKIAYPSFDGVLIIRFFYTGFQ
jgi:hypothetical protein